MRKNLLGIFIVSSLMLAGAGCLPSVQIEQSGMMSTSTTTVSDQATVPNDGAMMMKKNTPTHQGTYEMYRAEKIAWFFSLKLRGAPPARQ